MRPLNELLTLVTQGKDTLLTDEEKIVLDKHLEQTHDLISETDKFIESLRYETPTNPENDIIIIGFDINKQPYLIWANNTNGTETRQSDAEFLLDDYQNFGNWEEVLGITGMAGTTAKYTYKIVGDWDYEHIEFDYEIKLTKV